MAWAHENVAPLPPRGSLPWSSASDLAALEGTAPRPCPGDLLLAASQGLGQSRVRKHSGRASTGGREDHLLPTDPALAFPLVASSLPFTENRPRYGICLLEEMREGCVGSFLLFTHLFHSSLERLLRALLWHPFQEMIVVAPAGHFEDAVQGF